jgi:predicted transcriptional regulator
MMLHSALDRLLVSDVGAVCVTDNEGHYQGVITIDTIMRELRSTHQTRHDFVPTKGGR